MKIEAGKYYRNRAGDVVGPIIYDGHKDYPFDLGPNTYVSWDENGFEYYEGFRKGRDLIEEVPAPHVEAEPEYGPEIQVDGKRPAWLEDDDCIKVFLPPYGHQSIWDVGKIPKENWAWCFLIRLPSDHWANSVIGQGFEPWAGGDTAPDDWAGGDVLLRDGGIGSSFFWKHALRGSNADIIGYRKKGEQVYTAKTISVGYTLTGDLATIARLQAENAALSAELAAARAKHPDLVPDPDQALKDEILAFSRGQDWYVGNVSWDDPDAGNAAAIYAWEKRNDF